MYYFTSRLLEKIRSYQTKDLGDCLVIIKLIIFTLKFFINKFFRVKPSINKLNIGFIFSGGIGDQIISAQWVKVFIEKLSSEDISFYSVLMFPKESIGCLITQGYSRVDKVTTRKYLKFHKFDLLFNVDMFVKIYYVNFKQLQKYSQSLIKDIKNAHLFSNKLIHFSSAEYHYSIMHYALMKGWNRYDLMGACGLCKFSRETIPYFFVDHKKEEKVLEKFKLKDVSFITIHTGIGGIPNDGILDLSKKNYIKKHATKCIPIPLCIDIIDALKQKYNDIVIVQIGDSSSAVIPNVDMQLLEKTSFEESLYLLYSAKCHIDNDAGLVHIRHAMNKRSVVLFGPTSGDFIGYDNDVNIQGKCNPCMWLSKDWNVKCMRGYKNASCMMQIDPNEVVEGVQKILFNTYN